MAVAVSPAQNDVVGGRMFEPSAIELDFRPETYRLEGFVPFVAEEDPGPIAVLDPLGEVYRDADDEWSWVNHPDEVVLATIQLDMPHRICAYHDDAGLIYYRSINRESAGSGRAAGVCAGDSDLGAAADVG